MPAKLGPDPQNGSDPLQSPPIPTVELSHGVRQIGDRGLAPCVQAADSTQAGEFLQDEIEIRRGATFATLEFGAAFTTTFDWMAFLGSIRILVITRPGLSLGVLGCPPDCLHFVAWCVAVRDLHKLSVTEAALPRPKGVFRWAYFSGIVMKEDHRQLSRLLPEDFCDVDRGFPTHHLSTHGSALENEMKERPWATIFIIGCRS